MALPPTCLAMVMCDNIIQDPETKKYFLLGTANTTFARNFPARYQKLCLYVVLTGIHEPLAVEVKMVFNNPATAEDNDVMSIAGRVEAADPLAVAELAFGMRNVPFPQAGEYRFQLWGGGAFLAERKFVVKQMEEPKNKA